MDAFELKPLSAEAVPAALRKAGHYRLLNEPGQAESICQDVLRVTPDNQAALVQLVLALSDQFERRQLPGVEEAQGYVERLTDPYERTYYAGIVCERRGTVVLKQHRPRYQVSAYHWLREAMKHYEAAEALRPEGNDDAILRWNTCVRILERHPELGPESDEPEPQSMLE